jgi:hypothetical protein
MLFVVVYVDDLMNSWRKLRLMMGYSTRVFALERAQGDESQTG